MPARGKVTDSAKPIAIAASTALPPARRISTAASVAALTIYDMCKAVDRGMVIEQVQLLEKLGGKSGHYRKEEEGQA